MLVADELTATLLAEVPQDRLAGVVVRDGAANSHAAILVRAMGVPTVMGADIQPSLLSQRLLIVDGYRGELLVDPEPVLVQEYQRLISEELELSKLAEDDVEQPAQLKSGERIQVMLNAGLSPEHEQLLGGRVDGVGLYRTEIPFMLQSGFPSEEEQVAQYGACCSFTRASRSRCAPRTSAPTSSCPICRSAKRTLARAGAASVLPGSAGDLFDSGARDAACQRRHRQLGILLPMVTSTEEVDEAKRLIDRAGREVEEVLGYTIPKPKIGVMLEVPSMIFLIPHLAGRVDFISVGTNDLTQYLLAVDRNNTRVASLYDSLHPAMLQVLRLIAEQGKAAGLQLSLCGELAGDPMGALLLVGMGYRNLSMNGRSVARIKYLLRHIDLADAEVLAQRVLNTQMTTEVRHLVAAFMERRGMGGLIRGADSRRAV